MDLHDFNDVAQNYDKYINSLVGFAGFDNETCVKFHEELAKEFGADGIIDIGCGTGLIMLPLLRSGYKVTGVDLSQQMLDQCDNKLKQVNIDTSKAELINANMSNFELDNKASLALIPRSGFLHLLTCEDQIAALCSINKNLKLNGRLSLNTFYPSYDRISEMGNGKEENPFYRTTFTNDDGNKVDIYNSMVYYHDTQIMRGEWSFHEKDSNDKVIGVVKHPVTMRWSFKSEMELLFKLSGFEVEKIYGGYDKTDVSYPGQIVWVVKKIEEL